jgi:hypothetical protein
MKPLQRLLSCAGFLFLAVKTPEADAGAANVSTNSFLEWAARPPMGWNSWDCFGCTVTEQLTKTNADYMAEHLKRHGWEYIVVDIQWYEPQSTGWEYSTNPQPVLDEYGRLWPVIAKFPSAADGRGFKPLADYIHARGLKFGLHLLRGIPREAVKRNTRILGSNYHAEDIADRKSICRWNPDMYGIDMSKPGAQEYYDSVFRLFADWNLDFVKVDDIASPYRQSEIDAIRKAIDHCGRPIVLSLSPGPAPLAKAEQVIHQANLWRLTDDFWDNWKLLRHAFDTCNAWTPYRAAGHWPDPDMLPLGAVHIGPKLEHKWTKFTNDEQRTLMTLWCISRAPLMFGGHLPWSDAFTLSLITNSEVLALDQSSTGNRQLFRQGDLAAWTAEVPQSTDRYLALFYAPESDVTFDSSKALFRSEVIRGTPGQQTAEVKANIAGVRTLYLRVNDGGDNSNWDHADWLEPRLIGTQGETKLTGLRWRSATAGWGEARVNRSVTDHPLMLNGKPVAWGIGTHAESLITFDLPPGYRTLEAMGALDPGSHGDGSIQFEVYGDDAARLSPVTAVIKVSLADLGFKEKVRVRDLWAQQELGEFSGTFTRTIRTHGAALYRISAIVPP